MDISTSQQYERFARFEARGRSALYEELAQGVAGDGELLSLLDTLPLRKRQPNLLFAAVRFLHGTATNYEQFRGWVLDSPEEILEVIRTGSTQTNEPARVAAMLPVLAQIQGPIALVEVGASAGLCLYPDRFHYDFDGHQLGPEDSPVQLHCAIEGAVPLPQRLPEVVWRAGIDLNPLDVRSEGDLTWLRSLIFPEQIEREQRLVAAAAVARQDPPLLVAGDLNEGLDDLLAQAPSDTTVVLFHASVLSYLSADGRAAFYEKAMRHKGFWISQEAGGVFPEINAKVQVEAPERAVYVLAVAGEPVAFSEPHGGWLRWL